MKRHIKKQHSENKEEEDEDEEDEEDNMEEEEIEESKKSRGGRYLDVSSALGVQNVSIFQDNKEFC